VPACSITFTCCCYPLQGIAYLTSTPQLLKVVLKFLAVVTAASAALTIAWIHLAWEPHLALVAKLFGINFFSKLVTLLLLLAESALPVYAVFDHRFKRMQRQLFVATLQLKGVQVSPLCQADAAAITAQLAKQQQQQQQAAASNNTAAGKSSLAVGAAASLASLAFRILLKPKPNEGLMVRKTRDFVTLGTSLFLPLLLPLYVYRDSHAEASSLLSGYWHSKGVKAPEAQELVAAARSWELRGFGLVAVGLSYVPVLSWFLGLSNMVGAALYAAALEARGSPLLPKGKVG
jgi:hypothetical protein